MENFYDDVIFESAGKEQLLYNLLFNKPKQTNQESGEIENV
jgi:hypothetical protein